MAAAPTITLTFGRNITPALHLLSGWAQPDTDATWTLGSTAELHFPKPPVSDYALHITYRAFMAPARPWQRVRLLVGPTLAGQFVAAAQGEAILWLPQELVAAAPDPMPLRFELPDCASPALYRQNDDARELGLAMRQIVLKPLSPKIDPASTEAAWMSENIGRNCEFGVVQRLCGAEPISLLRWSGAPTRGLIDALANNFEGLLETATGVGVPRPLPPDKQKWWLTCSRYQILFHTGENVATVPLKQAIANVRKRLRWQAGKLMDDLRAGEKVFVYSSSEFATSDDTAEIVGALRGCGAFGPLMLIGAGASEPVRQIGVMTWFARLPALTGMTNAISADLAQWLPVLSGIQSITKGKQPTEIR